MLSSTWNARRWLFGGYENDSSKFQKKEVDSATNEGVLETLVCRTPGPLHRRAQVSFSSRDYWEHRYAGGGSSGAGSRGREAHFKADTVLRWADAFGAESVLDLGIGDGEVASLLLKRRRFSSYVGADFSPAALRMCHDKLIHYDEVRLIETDISATVPAVQADLVLCLDVLFHVDTELKVTRILNSIYGAVKKVAAIATWNSRPPGPLAPHCFYWPLSLGTGGGVYQVHEAVVPTTMAKSVYVLTKRDCNNSMPDSVP